MRIFITVDDFLQAASAPQIEDDEMRELIIKFEKYLNFLWRIAFAHLVLKTIPSADLSAFGAYFSAIERHDELRVYCLHDGYDEIIKAAKKIKRSV